MAPPLDPYRTLGIQPGASADEIRRAYRRLAKANHPDSAGEAALPRFLAIQQAYEMLVAARAARRPAAGRNPTSSEASRADPARARATRDPYARRRPPGSGSGAGAAKGGGDGAAAGTAGPPPRTGGAGDRPRRPGGRARSPNKATLGSTSYDAAEDEPFEPEWSGGTWYGASSGTYWTLNPKEYADPRKHGPEYQRRARRRLDGLEEDPAEEGPSIAGEDFVDPESETAAGEPGRARFDGRWAYPDDDREAPDEGAAAGGTWEVPPSEEADEAVEAAARPSASVVADRLLRGDVGIVGRIALVFVGWLPIGAAIAWLAGEVTGCGRFTASCVDPSGIGALIPQLVVIVVFAALPSLAALSAAGFLGALALSVPVAVVLSAGGGSRQPEVSSAVVSGLLVVGYVLGTALAAARRLGWRRVP